MTEVYYKVPSVSDVKKGVGYSSALLIQNTILTGGFAILTSQPAFYIASGALFLTANRAMNVGKKRIIASQREDARRQAMINLGFRNE